MSTIQDIGIVIDLSKGTYSNTIYKDGKLQLIELTKDDDGRPIYANYGYWESEPIVIQDKIRAFKNLVKNVVATGNAEYKTYVQTSEDGFSWNEYVETAADGTISNAPAKFSRIKIEFFPESLNANFFFDKFDEVGKYDNELTNSDKGVLELKKKYSGLMEDDAENLLFRKMISSSDYKKINKIKVSLIEGE